MIEVHGLSYAYASRQALCDISFRVARGQLVSVLGMNGSGKSTLLRNLAGLLQPQAGSIRLHGRELHQFSRQERARSVGYLPQNAAAADCTVFDAVLTGRTPHLGWQVAARDLAETERMLALTGLTGFADRPVNQLSGGELQRVAIARTLCQQPSLLLLDEPVNHLDIRSQIDIMALIRQLTNQLGLITITVLHDLNTALRFSDGFVLLQQGRLLAQGGHDVLSEAVIREAYQLQVVLHHWGGLPVVVPCPDQEPSLVSLARLEQPIDPLQPLQSPAWQADVG